MTIRYIQNNLLPVPGRPWQAEMSGRLLSLAHDIREKADEAATKINRAGIYFRFVMFVKVEAVRNDPNLDICADKKDDDPAHANLVVYNVQMAPELMPNQTPKMAHDFVQAIVTLFSVYESADLSWPAPIRWSGLNVSA